MMAQNSFDYIIIGSGTAGAVLAHTLSERRKSVLIIEGGKREEKIGTFSDCCRYFDANPITKIPKKSIEGVILWRTFMVGGSSIVSCGNGVRSLQNELDQMGFDLEKEFNEAEEYTHTTLIDESLLSEGSIRMRQAAEELGYQFELMPKMINVDKCNKDHGCSLGCRYNARWSADDPINQAIQNGTKLLTETWVDHIIIEHDKVVSIAVNSAKGSETIPATNVILAAGGLGTPVILQRSGIKEAGTNLFIDMFINVYGTTKGLNLVHEPQMSLVDLQFHKDEGFLLSPYVNLPRQVRLIEAGVKGSLMSANNMIGIMIKTRDDCVGRVFPDSKVSKPVTKNDQKRLDHGKAIAEEILVKTGADPRSIIFSEPQGAHPGGTAAIGTVVDTNLKTRVDGLYVCDASVLPVAPGLPPIIVIIALAKRLAKYLP
jgi:choline dehydrogenase-like flavoprotein